MPRLKVPKFESCQSWKWVQHFLPSNDLKDLIVPDKFVCKIFIQFWSNLNKPQFEFCSQRQFLAAFLARDWKFRLHHFYQKSPNNTLPEFECYQLKVPKIKSCQDWKFPILKVAKVESKFSISCQIAKLSNCQVAKLPSCKLLNCELAIMERNPFRSC